MNQKDTPHASHPWIRQASLLARLLDAQFRLPIIGKRIGLDPLFGLVPGGGTLLSVMLALYILWIAYRLALPRSILIRMGINIAIDSVLSTVPVAGAIVDMFWRANLYNVRLLEKGYRDKMRETDFESSLVLDISATPAG